MSGNPPEQSTVAELILQHKHNSKTNLNAESKSSRTHTSKKKKPTGKLPTRTKSRPHHRKTISDNSSGRSRSTATPKRKTLTRKKRSGKAGKRKKEKSDSNAGSQASTPKVAVHRVNTGVLDLVGVIAGEKVADPRLKQKPAQSQHSKQSHKKRTPEPEREDDIVGDLRVSSLFDVSTPNNGKNRPPRHGRAPHMHKKTASRNEFIVKCGFVERRTKATFIGRWQRKFMTLTPQAIFLLKNENGDGKKQSLSLLNIVSVRTDKENTKRFEVAKVNGEVVLFECKSTKEALGWAYAISDALLRARDEIITDVQRPRGTSGSVMLDTPAYGRLRTTPSTRSIKNTSSQQRLANLGGSSRSLVSVSSQEEIGGNVLLAFPWYDEIGGDVYAQREKEKQTLSGRILRSQTLKDFVYPGREALSFRRTSTKDMFDTQRNSYSAPRSSGSRITRTTTSQSRRHSMSSANDVLARSMNSTFREASFELDFRTFSRAQRSRTMTFVTPLRIMFLSILQEYDDYLSPVGLQHLMLPMSRNDANIVKFLLETMLFPHKEKHLLLVANPTTRKSATEHSHSESKSESKSEAKSESKARKKTSTPKRGQKKRNDEDDSELKPDLLRPVTLTTLSPMNQPSVVPRDDVKLARAILYLWLFDPHSAAIDIAFEHASQYNPSLTTLVLRIWYLVLQADAPEGGRAKSLATLTPLNLSFHSTTTEKMLDDAKTASQREFQAHTCVDALFFHDQHALCSQSIDSFHDAGSKQSKPRRRSSVDVSHLKQMRKSITDLDEITPPHFHSKTKNHFKKPKRRRLGAKRSQPATPKRVNSDMSPQKESVFDFNRIKSDEPPEVRKLRSDVLRNGGKKTPTKKKSSGKAKKSKKSPQTKPQIADQGLIMRTSTLLLGQKVQALPMLKEGEAVHEPMDAGNEVMSLCKSCLSSADVFSERVLSLVLGSPEPEPLVPRVINALFFMLITDISAWYNLNDSLPLFGQRVRNPAIWRSLFRFLHHIPLRQRAMALEDVTSLLVRSSVNHDSIVSQEGWTSWVIPVFFDVRPNLLETPDKLTKYERDVYRYGMSTMSLLTSRCFFTLEEKAWEAVITSIVHIFQSRWPDQSHAQALIRAWLVTLIIDITKHRVLFEYPQIKPRAWGNLVYLVHAVKIYLFATPSHNQLQAFRGHLRGISRGDTGFLSVKNSANDVNAADATNPQKVRFGDAIAFGIHRSASGQCLDREIIERTQVLLKALQRVLEPSLTTRNRSASVFSMFKSETYSPQKFLEEETHFFQDASDFMVFMEYGVLQFGQNEVATTTEKFIGSDSKARTKILEDFKKNELLACIWQQHLERKAKQEADELAEAARRQERYRELEKRNRTQTGRPRNNTTAL